jgi:hypothetical protein
MTWSSARTVCTALTAAYLEVCTTVSGPGPLVRGNPIEQYSLADTEKAVGYTGSDNIYSGALCLYDSGDYWYKLETGWHSGYDGMETTRKYVGQYTRPDSSTVDFSGTISGRGVIEPNGTYTQHGQMKSGPVLTVASTKFGKTTSVAGCPGGP